MKGRHKATKQNKKLNKKAKATIAFFGIPGRKALNGDQYTWNAVEFMWRRPTQMITQTDKPTKKYKNRYSSKDLEIQPTHIITNFLCFWHSFPGHFIHLFLVRDINLILFGCRSLVTCGRTLLWAPFFSQYLNCEF